MTPPPLLSVIVPAYNAEKTLSRTLRSVQKVVDRDVECIVVSDGSTDNTCNIAESFASGDDRFSVIQFPANGGRSTARNAGIERSRGSYVFFVDADDIIFSESFSVFVGRVRHGSEDMIGGTLIQTHGELSSDSQANGHADETFALLRHNRYLFAVMPFFSRFAYRRAFLERNNIRFPGDRFIGEDRLFLLRAQSLATTASVTNIPVYGYHLADSNTVHNDWNLEKQAENVRFLEDAVRMLHDTAQFDELNAFLVHSVPWQLHLLSRTLPDAGFPAFTRLCENLHELLVRTPNLQEIDHRALTRHWTRNHSHQFRLLQEKKYRALHANLVVA